MTLAPSRDLGHNEHGPRLTALEDDTWCKTYELLVCCAVPGCPEEPEPGAHHIEPRSRTGGPRLFVVVDGVVVPNTCRLCWRHHREVTGGIGGYTARVVYRDGCWVWQQKRGNLWSTTGPLRGIPGNTPITS